LFRSTNHNHMRAFLPLLALSLSVSATAQWSIDPADPMSVCDAVNDQRFMRAIADADSGYYVFWSDLRNSLDKADLYGQRFDSEGNALWIANGELLLSHPTKSINQLAPLLMPDGSLMVTYFTGGSIYSGDTVRCMRFDANGNALWSEASVALVGGAYTGLGVVPSGESAYVMAYDNGIVYGCRLQRVQPDGSVQFPVAGPVVTALYGPFTVQPDGVGGMLLSIRCGNGAGTCLKAQRFDSLGTAVWPGYIDLADASGLGYAFATTMGEDAAQTAVWEVNGDLRMSRVDTLGNMLWSPAVLPAVELATHVQQKPATTIIGNELFVAWSDNRPPANYADLYVQKYDLATGAELWATDGIAAIQFSTFTPEPSLLASDSGAVIALFEGTVDGFSAMRIRNDGTLAWVDPVALCLPALNPNPGQRVQLSDGNGGAVVFWQSTNGNFHGARVYRNGRLYNDVGIYEADPTHSLHAYPNPTTDMLQLDLPSDLRILQAELINAQGQVTSITITGRSLSLHGLPAGGYVLRVRTATSVFTTQFIKN
jgi:hypothetical protein